MYTVDTGLIRKVPIVEHSSIKENELAAVLITIWSRFMMEPQVTERWVQKTCNYLSTVRELIGSDDTTIAVFVVRGLVSEIRHLDRITLTRLVDEIIERKQLGSLLNVLNLKSDPCKTPDEILDALSKGLRVEFNSSELNVLKLRERDTRDVAAIMLLAGVSDDGVVYEDELESSLRNWANANLATYSEDLTFDSDSIKELLHLNCKLTNRQLKDMSEKQQDILRGYTSMNTMTEVYAKVKIRKEILFDEEDIVDKEPIVQTYPSLTHEGVIVGKAISYTLGRMPLEQRKELLIQRLTDVQKERSILLFSNPGQYTITTAECVRLSDFASQFVFDIINRMESDEAQTCLLSLVTKVGLLDQQ